MLKLAKSWYIYPYNQGTLCAKKTNGCRVCNRITLLNVRRTVLTLSLLVANTTLLQVVISFVFLASWLEFSI
jgi:hypothetical protein